MLVHVGDLWRARRTATRPRRESADEQKRPMFHGRFANAFKSNGKTAVRKRPFQISLGRLRCPSHSPEASSRSRRDPVSCSSSIPCLRTLIRQMRRMLTLMGLVSNELTIAKARSLLGRNRAGQDRTGPDGPDCDYDDAASHFGRRARKGSGNEIAKTKKAPVNPTGALLVVEIVEKRPSGNGCSRFSPGRRRCPSRRPKAKSRSRRDPLSCPY